MRVGSLLCCRDLLRVFQASVLIVVVLFVVRPVLSEQSDCDLGVRLIRAVKSNNASHSKNVHLDPALDDVRGRLLSLPFSEFELLDHKETSTNFHKSSRLTLKGVERANHNVVIVPQSLMGQRVCFEVDWRGRDGERYLSTGMRPKNSQTIVLVADHVGNTSTLLAVTVRCR